MLTSQQTRILLHNIYVTGNGLPLATCIGTCYFFTYLHRRQLPIGLFSKLSSEGQKFHLIYSFNVIQIRVIQKHEKVRSEYCHERKKVRDKNKKKQYFLLNFEVLCQPVRILTGSVGPATTRDVMLVILDLDKLHPWTRLRVQRRDGSRGIPNIKMKSTRTLAGIKPCLSLIRNSPQ